MGEWVGDWMDEWEVGGWESGSLGGSANGWVCG